MAKDLVEITDSGEMRVGYHPGQALALASLAPETYIIAGLQSGKTTFLPHWLRQEMKRCGPGHRTLVYLAIGPTFSVLGNKCVPEFVRVFQDILGWGRYIATPKARIEINETGDQALWGHVQKQRTSIYFCYADDPNSFAGFTALAAVGDEVGQPRFRRSAYTELKGRLTVARGDVGRNNRAVGLPADLTMGRFCVGSIVYGLNWIFENRKQYVKALQEAKATDPDWMTKVQNGTIHPVFQFVRFDSTLNPAFPASEFQAAKDTMEAWYFNMRYRGMFSRPAGLIYNAWRTKFEIPFSSISPIPSHWRSAAAFDPGDVNFYGMRGFNEPDSPVWTITDLYHDAEKDFYSRGQEISEMWPNLEWAIVGQLSEERWRNQLRAGGLHCSEPPTRDFWSGIQNNIAAMLKGYIRVCPDTCGDLLDGFGTYSRPIDEATGNVIYGRKPEDEDSRHYEAAFRYFGTKAFYGLGHRARTLAAGELRGESSAPSNSSVAKSARSAAAKTPNRRAVVTGNIAMASKMEAPMIGSTEDPALF